MVHARDVGGRTLSFGHSGWLWNSAYLLYDRDTGSIWHHASGIAMSGPMRGTRLRRYAQTALMTFDAWRAEHPDTLVLAKPPEGPDRVEEDVYASRNAGLSFGLAVEAAGAYGFFPLRDLGALGVVEDSVGDVPVVVARDAAGRSAVAYDRRVDGRALSFEAVADGVRPRLRERGGERAWWLRSGTPVAGTGATSALRPLPATPWEERAFRLAHPSGSPPAVR